MTPKINAIQVPDKWRGQSVEGAMERLLKGEAEKQNTPQVNAPPIPSSDEYIYLPKHNLYVAKQRSMHGLKWQETWNELENKGSKMLTPRQFVDFLNLLRTGAVTDGNGKQVSKYELLELYNDITEVRVSCRAEWLDAYFREGKNKLNYMLTENRRKEERLEVCLMEDKIPGIDFEDWLKNANSQGLPRENIPDGDLYYWHPRSGRVARFDADSDRADLNCSRYPDYLNSSLGVREAVSAAGVKGDKK